MRNAGDEGAVQGEDGCEEIKPGDECARDPRDPRERSRLRPIRPSQEPVGVSIQDASAYLRSRERSTASDPARNEIPAMARLGSTSGAAPLVPDGGPEGCGGGGGG